MDKDEIIFNSDLINRSIENIEHWQTDIESEIKIMKRYVNEIKKEIKKEE